MLTIALTQTVQDEEDGEIGRQSQFVTSEFFDWQLFVFEAIKLIIIVESKEIMNNLSDIVGKKHRAPKSGVKAKKKEATKKKKLGLSTERHNPRAFSVANVVRTKRTQQRNLDRLQQKEVVPLINRADELPPPVFIVIMGPKDVGKSTLIRSLVKIYTGQNLTDTKGPITCVAGRKRRITIFECPLDMYSMTDLAKVADLVLLMVDASYGFEMETFEYLNMLQLHGFPKVVGVMTHLDKFKMSKSLQNTKKLIKHRFWTEIYKGAKMFELSGVVNGKYLKHEIKRLSLYLQRVKFRPLVWRNTHPYVVVDRVEDVTPMSKISQDNNCDRDVALFGYVRGTHLKESMKMHLIGAGDFDIAGINFLGDPCPLPGGTESTADGKVVKKVSLKAKDTLLYAPMANVGRVQMSDRDGVFIELRDIHYTKREHLTVLDQKIHRQGKRDDNDDNDDDDDEGADDAQGPGLYGDNIARDTPMGLLRNMQDVRRGVDELIQDSEMTLFPHSRPIKSSQMQDAPAASETVKKQSKYHTLPDYDSEEEDDQNDEGGHEDDDEDTDEDNDEDDEEEGYDDEGDDGDDDEPESAPKPASANAVKKKATSEFLARLQEQDGRDIMRRIYGDLGRGHSGGAESTTNGFDRDDTSDNDDDDDDNDDLFVVKSSTSKHDKYAKANARDSSRAASTVAEVISKWSTALELTDSTARNASTIHSLAAIKERCVTGSWGGENIALGVKGRNSDRDDEEGGDDGEGGDGLDDEEIYGDFEDLETGESFGGSTTQKGRASTAPTSDDDDEEDENGEYDFDYANEDENGVDEDEYEDADAGDDQYDDQYDDDDEDEDNNESGLNLHGNQHRARMSAQDLDAHNDDIDRQLREMNAKKKLSFKSKFDSDYDTHQDGDGEEEDGEGGSKGKNGKKKHLTEQEEEEQKLFEMAKKLQQDQRDRNKAEFGEDGDLVRVRHEGYRQGMYVRILLKGVPVEFTRNFRPQLPVILGGLLPHECTMGFFRVRVKRHRWYQKILKSNDPIVFSVGWRRYQSLPVFTMEDQNQRERFLKYTPEHMHCACVIYGPLVPPNTGVLAYQKASNRVSGFRICLTGTVLEHQATPTIMKKLKLVGTPIKIFKNTAFVTGMFNSALEVAKFEGVKLKTVSGIRGQIKKALHEGQPGNFRATFEDKILISDIIICRLWVPVEVTKFCNPVMSLLTDATAKVDEWQGMRSQAQIRKEEKIPITYNKDSLYKPIERVQREFGKVNVSKKLEESLPFASKSKLEKVKNPSSYLARRAVVLEPEDRKKRGLVHMVSSIAKDKIEKRKLAKENKTKQNAKAKAREQDRFADVHKEEKKKRYRDEGKESIRREKKKNRRAEAQDN